MLLPCRLIHHCPRFSNITPVLIALHWLSVKYRVEFKVALLLYKPLNHMAPIYMAIDKTRIVKRIVRIVDEQYEQSANSRRILQIVREQYEQSANRRRTVQQRLCKAFHQCCRTKFTGARGGGDSIDKHEIVKTFVDVNGVIRNR